MVQRTLVRLVRREQLFKPVVVPWYGQLYVKVLGAPERGAKAVDGAVQTAALAPCPGLPKLRDLEPRAVPVPGECFRLPLFKIDARAFQILGAFDEVPFEIKHEFVAAPHARDQPDGSPELVGRQPAEAFFSERKAVE